MVNAVHGGITGCFEGGTGAREIEGKVCDGVLCAYDAWLQLASGLLHAHHAQLPYVCTSAATGCSWYASDSRVRCRVAHLVGCELHLA